MATSESTGGDGFRRHPRLTDMLEEQVHTGLMGILNNSRVVEGGKAPVFVQDLPVFDREV
jgi:hypothetical protein